MRGPSAIELTATIDGEEYVFSAAADVTSTWQPGDYWYSVRVTSGAAVQELESGQFTITPDMAAAGSGFDGRSSAEIALAAIEAVLANRATMDQDRYRINNRELYRTSISDLLKLRDFYRDLVNRERAAKCGQNPFGRKVRVSLK